MNEVLPQGPRSETNEQEGPQGGIPHVADHTPMRGPKNGFQNDSGILQELSGMCQNQFDLMVYPETTFRYHRNLSDDLSAVRFRCPKLFGVRNFFGDFLSDSLSSIQQIDDP